MKTQDLLKKIENQVAAMQDVIEAEPATLQQPWMMQTTKEEDDLSKAIKIAHHAAEVRKLSLAIVALSEGKTVTETALGDFEIA